MKLFFNIIKKICNIIEESTKNGYKWIGVDGLLNIETSALLTIFLNLLFNNFYSIIITFLIMLFKCIVDYINGHINEKHDFICVCIGIFIGFLLNLK